MVIIPLGPTLVDKIWGPLSKEMMLFNVNYERRRIYDDLNLNVDFFYTLIQQCSDEISQ